MPAGNSPASVKGWDREDKVEYKVQGSKIALVRSYLRVPQAAGQVNIMRFLVNIKFSPYIPILLCDAGQVPIFRYFEV